MKYELLLCPEKQVVYVWMWQREEGYEISWVSVVREVWMARVSFPLHSVQIKMVVVIEVICFRVKKKRVSTALSSILFSKLCFCPVVLAVLDDSCNSLNYFHNCLYARFCSQLREHDIRNYSSHVNGVMLIFFFLMWCSWEHLLVPSVLTPVSKNREAPTLLNGDREWLIFLADITVFLSAWCEEAWWSIGMYSIFSIPLPAGLGQQKMRGDWDPLAMWVGGCLISSYFLEHGIWLLGGGCRQGCKWDICRENAYTYFLFPKLQYCSFWCAKAAFRFCWLPVRFRLSPTLTSPCSRLGQELIPSNKDRGLMVTQLRDRTSLL